MMQRLFFRLLRSYVWLALHIFFRRIRVSGLDQIPPGAVLFTANHQNAFLDALLIVCSSKRYTHFLARADIFRKRWARSLLRLINLLPIYRVRDGWQSLNRNHETFAACSHLLAAQQAIVIFPEGNHGSARRLRPLSKGFSRVAFQTLRLQPALPLFIVPVGLNYTDPTHARSSVHIKYGPPLRANTYFEMGEPQGAQALRDALSFAMQQLITHLPEQPAPHVEALTSQPVDFLEPERINAWIANPALPLPLHNRQPDIVGTLWRLLLFPIALAWQRWDAKIKDRVFVGSLKFAFVFGIVNVAVVVVVIIAIIWTVWTINT